jgi:hypothetical protein
MKLKDFIEKLQQLDPDADVEVVEYDDYGRPIPQDEWQEPTIRMQDFKGRRVVCLY